jgi:hypothetical protein
VQAVAVKGIPLATETPVVKCDWDKASVVARIEERRKELLQKEKVATEYTKRKHQVITRSYLDLLNAVDKFYDDPEPYTPYGGFLGCVVAFALVLIVVAGAVSRGANGDAFSVEAFIGWTAEANAFVTFKNLYCGLMLGLVFGFLDNAGLFYGMSMLDPLFYQTGSNIVCSLRAFISGDDKSLDFEDNTPSAQLPQQQQRRRLRAVKDAKELAVKDAKELHKVTEDLMSGLGNTFSDLMGVAFGTAALELAKAGLGTDPSFWPLDLVAMFIGCMLGCIVPAMHKHREVLNGDKKYHNKPCHWFLGAELWSFLSLGLLLLSIVFAAIPAADSTAVEDGWAFWVSLGLLTSLCALLAAALLLPCCFANGAMRRTWGRVHS